MGGVLWGGSVPRAGCARSRQLPAAKVEFTPSCAGPGFFVFSLSLTAVELSPSFLANAAAFLV